MKQTKKKSSKPSNQISTPDGISIKKNDPLRDEHHVTRFVSWSKVARDKDGNATGLLWQAFKLREGEGSMSVSWNEFYGGNADEKLKSVVNAYRNALSPKPKDVFAVSNVGQLKKLGKQQKQNVRIVFTPTKNIPAHCSISRFEAGGEPLMEAWAREGVVSWKSNSKI